MTHGFGGFVLSEGCYRLRCLPRFSDFPLSFTKSVEIVAHHPGLDLRVESCLALPS